MFAACSVATFAAACLLFMVGGTATRCRRGVRTPVGTVGVLPEIDVRNDFLATALRNKLPTLECRGVTVTLAVAPALTHTFGIDVIAEWLRRVILFVVEPSLTPDILVTAVRVGPRIRVAVLQDKPAHEWMNGIDLHRDKALGNQAAALPETLAENLRLQGFRLEDVQGEPRTGMTTVLLFMPEETFGPGDADDSGAAVDPAIADVQFVHAPA